MNTTEIKVGKEFPRLNNIIENSKYNNIVEFSGHFIIYFADLHQVVKYRIKKDTLTDQQYKQLSNNVKEQIYDKNSN